MFNDNAQPRWINQEGIPIREFNQRQKELFSTPFFELTLSLYLHAVKNNFSTATHQFNEINRALGQLAEEPQEANESDTAASNTI